MADLANSCDTKCKVCKFRKESWPFWLEWVVWRVHTKNLSGLVKPKNKPWFLQKMAELANSCDPKCRICEVWIESWPFWLEWVAWRLHTINLPGLAKPKKSAIIFAKNSWFSQFLWPKM